MKLLPLGAGANSCLPQLFTGTHAVMKNSHGIPDLVCPGPPLRL